MIKFLIKIGLIFVFVSCTDEIYESIDISNPKISLDIPNNFPPVNQAFYTNEPTLYGVLLGEKLFHDTRLSADNSISCASCHQKSLAFADSNPIAVGIYGRIGLRNVPPLQNLAFMKYYNWDGSKLQLEHQPIVPIITHEEMDSSILDVIRKIQNDEEYRILFEKAFGDAAITSDKIYRSIAQYEYSLVSFNSKYDKVKRNEGVVFTEIEHQGWQVFNQKCIQCHNTELFTDQSFRNKGFPINMNSNEAGRARVTGKVEDYMRFRVPSLRNIMKTAPYGSFGQFVTLKEVLDYMDSGVVDSENLDSILKNNNNRIPLTEVEKNQLLAFLNTLTDFEFIGLLNNP